MDMIIHNTEVPQLEMEPGFRLFNEGQEQELELGSRKTPVTMVNFRGDMVHGSIAEHS
jgi:hypothetical protein